ncbi:hypothetical protein BDZ45DRAFT_15149 [Acephala macrosclerotiorum]|nr:hypothetical protein BDZ45DRAFT_15149 [Acephala macrosclerotiorum]
MATALGANQLSPTLSKFDPNLQLSSDQVNQLRAAEARGAKFSRFSLLPLEIRRMIWSLSVTASQIHLMGGKRHIRTKFSTVLACKEAFEEALKVTPSLPYFYIAVDPQAAFRDTRNFVNYNEDTFWISDQFLRETIHCSECAPYPDNVPWLSGQSRSVATCLCRPENRMGALAINNQTWGRYDLRDSIAFSLHHHKVRKLYIVISNHAQPADRDIVFADPPAQRIPPTWGGRVRDWEEANKGVEKTLEALKEKRARERQAMLVAGKTGQEIDKSGKQDLSGWRLPSARFVEAWPAASLGER